MWDTPDFRHTAMADLTAYTCLKFMSAPLKLHFPEAHGITVPAIWLGPGTTVEIDIAKAHAASFPADTCTAGPDRTAAHPVANVRGVTTGAPSITVRSRTIVTSLMADFDKQR